jgi:hypothetical protein
LRFAPRIAITRGSQGENVAGHGASRVGHLEKVTWPSLFCTIAQPDQRKTGGDNRAAGKI